MDNYDNLSLEDLREECTSRLISFNAKDGKRNLVSKLKVADKKSESLYSEEEEGAVGGSEAVCKDSVVSGIFEEQLRLLELQRVMRQEELQAMREEREVRAKEREERKEEEERQLKLLSMQLEMKKMETAGMSKAKGVVLLKMRDMREGEDIDDFFRVFELTANTQHIPKQDWLGNLIPRLSEKAKSVYLEIKASDAQDYDKAKLAILASYQLTVDHYRYKFRNSDKSAEEDFVQWARRTRRYLDRWMLVARATGDAERILEQITIERMLDAVGPELRAWLKEKKPVTAEELAKVANEHVQARKGPLIDGKYANLDKNKPKRNTSNFIPEQPRTNVNSHHINPIATRPFPQAKEEKRITSNFRGKCYKCQEVGHMSFNCPKVKQNSPLSTSTHKQSQPGSSYLCFTPMHKDTQFPEHFVKGTIDGIPAKMLVDTGCTRTLVHRKFVKKPEDTQENITILTATGERVTVPLVSLEIEVKQGKYKELVGVVDNLPVDCLLGRSSYGRVITRDDLLLHWGTDCDKALVTTRSQTKQKAQERIEELVDRENSLAKKTLSPPRDETTKSKPTTEIGEDAKQTTVEPTKSIKPEVSEVNILDRNIDQVVSDQRNDTTLTQCRNNVLTGAPKENDGYFYEKGLLMHRKFSENIHDGLPYVDRIVVPESYRPEILRVSHTLPLAGHLGKEKTISRIVSHFYWPRLSFDVGKYCATCPECQLVTRKMTSLRAPLQSVPIVTEPFRKIAIDIVGELPKTTTGYKYILTIVDYATRYPEAFPLRNVNSKTIADTLVTFFSRVGIPEEIVSDQGANLIGNLMTQLFEQLGVTRIKTSVYHPEANGLVERFNGTLKQMLRKFVSENVRLWDRYLPYLLFAYREVPCSSTGYSPFELLYGKTVRGPLAVIKESWMEKKTPERNLITYVLEMRRRMQTMQQAVYENMKESQDKQKKNYDKKSSVRKFEVGDKVLVLLPTPGSKLETKWQGPYTVTAVKQEGRTYEVDTGKSKKQLRTYNINILTRWQSKDETTAFVMEESCEMPLPHEKSLPQLTSDETWKDVVVSRELDKEQSMEVQKLLYEFSDVFSGKPNRTNAALHKIETGEAQPIRSAPYKVPQRLEKAVEDEVAKMLEMEIIQPSASPWASPVVIVPKPDGDIRFCVDYRKLNRVTKMDAYPLPRIDKMLERVSAANYITTLDLTKGYWQIPLEESTIEKSSFICSKGLFNFLVMPFGMKTAPATFQRMMTEVVLKGLEDFTDAYLDDVEIDTRGSFSQHMFELQQVLHRLRKFHLSARPSKCKIAMLTVDFIGHHVGNGCIRPKEALVKAVLKFPRPTVKKEVRSFLGLVGYYRKFISNFSDRAAVLSDLTRGNRPTKVIWSEVCESAFNDLKQAITSTPVLTSPKWHLQFIVQVDASNRGLGAVLSQFDEEGEEHPIGYASRKLQPREELLSTTEKECLAIVWAIELYRYYLYGRHFILQTDHNPLTWLSQVKDKSRKLLRWSLTIQEYDLEIQHKSGKKNVNADVLSRL